MLEDTRNLISMIVAVGILQACAATDSVDPFVEQGRSWPEDPDGPRIVHVGEFSDASDLGIRDSFWSKVVSVAAGASDKRLLRPMAVAATGDSQLIYVADADTQCVHRFDLRRSRYACLVPDDGAVLISPVGLAIRGDGRLYVSDSRLGRLYRADPGSRKLVPVDVETRLDQPTGLVWSDADERLYVTDTAQQTVIVLDADGRQIGRIGERGNLDGQLNFPTYLATDGDENLLVTDSLNFRVQRFDRDSEFVSTFGKNGDRPGDFSRPKGIATDSFDHIYVIDSLMHAVQVFNSEGELLLALGEHGRGVGQFWLPNGIFIAPDDTIYVADSYNKRIQVFRFVGPRS